MEEAHEQEVQGGGKRGRGEEAAARVHRVHVMPRHVEVSDPVRVIPLEAQGPRPGVVVSLRSILIVIAIDSTSNSSSGSSDDAEGLSSDSAGRSSLSIANTLALILHLTP